MTDRVRNAHDHDFRGFVSNSLLVIRVLHTPVLQQRSRCEHFLVQA